MIFIPSVIQRQSGKEQQVSQEQRVRHRWPILTATTLTEAINKLQNTFTAVCYSLSESSLSLKERETTVMLFCNSEDKQKNTPPDLPVVEDVNALNIWTD